MKNSSILLLFFCTFFLPNTTNAGEVDKQLHQKCLYPTIYVGRVNKSTYGSGVIVRSQKHKDGYRNVFLTCAHVVHDNYLDYEVKQFIYEEWSQVSETKTYPALFYAVNHEQDVAIGLFYSDEEMPVADLDFSPKIYIGNELFRIGCGLGGEPRLDYGKLTQYKKLPKPLFRTSVMTVPGDSGGPVFHENKVVAIIVSISSVRNLPVFNISFAVPLQRFKDWNDKIEKSLDFAWTKKKIPELQFRMLEFKQYEIK
jgi:S1-C subfamily serine protease